MAKPQVSREDVLKHNKESDSWIIIGEKVYKVDKWIQNHPGGAAPILSVLGKDATEPFRGFHPEYVWDKIKAFHVADLVLEDRRVSPAMEEFRRIHKELTDKGLFETNLYWYGRLAFFLALLFIGAIISFSFQTWTSITISAILLGLFWQQAAFVGHDLCHNSVSHVTKTDLLVATVTTSLMGISAAWWKSTHNIHHIVTNSLEQDPDIQHLPFIAITEKFFRTVYSRYHGRRLHFDILAKFLISSQHLLYYPVMCLARLNLYIQSIILYLRSKNIPIAHQGKYFPILDFTAVSLFLTWYTIMVSYLPSWQMKLFYVILSHSVAGILHVQITISHFGMPVNHDADEANRPYDFLRTQFEHSMDVDCPLWMDWFHGGLQFQVVHHLFPRLPRHNLRYVRDHYIVPFAKKYGFEYHHKDFLGANIAVLTTLRNTAIKARDFPNEKLAPIFVYVPLPNKEDHQEAKHFTGK